MQTPGLGPGRAAHSPSPVQGTPTLAAQMGRPAPLQSAAETHSTQRPLVGSHTGALVLRSAHAADPPPAAQETHLPDAASHSGRWGAPVQLVWTRHSTQRP